MKVPTTSREEDLIFCGEQVGKLLRRKGLTNEKLAEIVEKSSTTVSNWRSGKKLPAPESRRRMIEYFNLPEDYFVRPLTEQEATKKFLHEKIKSVASGEVPLHALIEATTAGTLDSLGFSENTEDYYKKVFNREKEIYRRYEEYCNDDDVDITTLNYLMAIDENFKNRVNEIDSEKELALVLSEVQLVRGYFFQSWDFLKKHLWNYLCDSQESELVDKIELKALGINPEPQFLDIDEENINEIVKDSIYKDVNDKSVNKFSEYIHSKREKIKRKYSFNVNVRLASGFLISDFYTKFNINESSSSQEEEGSTANGKKER